MGDPDDTRLTPDSNANDKFTLEIGRERVEDLRELFE